MSDAEAIRTLQDQVERLTRELGVLQDIQAVRTLHFKYGYYFDACLYEELVDLFADDAELKFLNGIYRGKAGVRRLYCDWLRNLWTGGRDGPVHGLLYDHLMLQDVVDISPDRRIAKGRFRALMMGGFHESVDLGDRPMPRQSWEAGVYENEYVKEDGVWKFRLFDYSLIWQASYEKGWAGSTVHLKPLTRTYPEDPTGPDELLPGAPEAWPHTRVVPFHYPHPVTGKVWQGVKS
jgi:hypothetical protein